MPKPKAQPPAGPASPNPTSRQGQFLAFIHQYTILNGRAPAEADMQRFFQVTAPSVHTMVVTLERRGFIERVPGQARSMRVLLAPALLPTLEPVQHRASSPVHYVIKPVRANVR